VLTSGCSLVFSKGPKSYDYDEMGIIDCSGTTLPVLDTIWAGLNGLGALQAVSTDDETWKKQNSSYDRSTVIASGLLWVVVSGVSAAYGYHNASECKRVKAEMRDGFGVDLEGVLEALGEGRGTAVLVRDEGQVLLLRG
jgi:hypothetical protein